MFVQRVNTDIKTIILSSFVILLIISTGIIYSANILKKETVEKQLTITKLNNSFISKDLNQHISNMELFIENISTIISFMEDESVTNTKLANSTTRFPLIRSINILDNEQIIYSSNQDNIGLFISENNFYPKPMFSDSILRISYPWIGRDFETGTNSISSDETLNDKASFIPILKTTYIDNNKFSIIINLNSDYLLNIFKELSKDDGLEVKLHRIDNILLLSNKDADVLGKKDNFSLLLNQAFNVNNSTGLENIHDIKYISSYSLVKDYPFIISTHLNYEDSLLAWNKKISEFFIVSIGIVLICLLFVLILVVVFIKNKNSEIAMHKLQIEDHEKFRHLFHDSSFLSAVLDKNGKLIEINNSALDFLGLHRDTVLNKNFWDFNCWPNKEKIFIEKLFDTDHPNEDFKQEINAFNKFNKKSVLEISIFAINKDSDNYKYIAIGQDITGRKQKEQKLEQAFTVFNSTKDGIVIIDKYNTIIDVNPSFELITGYDKKEILHKNINILKSNVHDSKFYQKMWSDLTKYGSWEGEITNSKKNKELYTEWLTINTILDKENNIISYIGIFSDITESKAKEALLKEKESVIFHQSKMAAMGEMIENIAHQWRQPLSIISTGATGVLMKQEYGLLEDNDLNKMMNQINDSAQYLSSTIDDFRGFLSTDKVLSDFDLKESIEASLKLISSKLKNRNIQIINDCESFKIHGLRNELVQVFINILNNARDVLEEKELDSKYIFISTDKKEDSIFITIKDNAGGIPSDVIDKVFEPYFTTKHKSQGTGIGLYMSNQIVSNHLKGTLIAKNLEFQYDDKQYTGACFEITIPLK